MKKGKVITSLEQATKATGLGLFLVFGLNGCSDKPPIREVCKDIANLQYASQGLIDECKKEREAQATGSGSSTHSSGGSSALMWYMIGRSSAPSTVSTSSGYFSPSVSSHGEASAGHGSSSRGG